MTHKMIIEIDTAKMRRDNVSESNIQDLLDFIVATQKRAKSKSKEIER